MQEEQNPYGPECALARVGSPRCCWADKKHGLGRRNLPINDKPGISKPECPNEP